MTEETANGINIIRQQIDLLKSRFIMTYGQALNLETEINRLNEQMQAGTYDPICQQQLELDLALASFKMMDLSVWLRELKLKQEGTC